ncbi:MAG: Ig-like domain-containing protein, partial [Chloroflexi bacterium]|nr:Ig-like domain-containing protein [Chloroflexota bacterium]
MKRSGALAILLLFTAFLLALQSSGTLAASVGKTISANPSMANGTLSGSYTDATANDTSRLGLVEAGSNGILGIGAVAYAVDANFNSWVALTEAPNTKVTGMQLNLIANATRTDDSWWFRLYNFSTSQYSAWTQLAATLPASDQSINYTIAFGGTSFPGKASDYVNGGGNLQVEIGDGNTSGNGGDVTGLGGANNNQTTLNVNYLGMTFAYDGTAPASTIASPANNAYIMGSSFPITISGAASDSGADATGVSKVEISTDGGANWSAASTSNAWANWTYIWTRPADGTYTIKTRATDNQSGALYAANANVETPAPGGTVTIDSVAPASGLTTSPASADGTNGWFKTAPSITLTSNEPGTTWYRWDAGSWIAYSTAITAPEGSHTLSYYSVDLTGNGETPTVQIFNVDTGAPSSSISAPANGSSINGSSYTVKGSASDADSGVAKVEVSMDGGATWNQATGTTSWTCSWTLPANGAYSIKSRATDSAGNVETPATGVAVTVDNTPPNITTITPADGAASVETSATVSAVFTEDVDPTTVNDSIFALRNSTNALVPASVTYDQAAKRATLTPTSALSNAITYTATITTGLKDLAGNTLASDYTWSFTTKSADLTPPVTTLSTNPANPDGLDGRFKTMPTITLTPSEPGATRFAWDSSSGPWTTYAAPFSGLEGNHTLYYYSVDASANTESVKTLAVNVDTVPPVTTIATNPLSPDGTNGWYKTAPVIDLTNNEPGTTYFQWDGTGGAWTTYSAAITAPESQHTLYFFSADSAGNHESVKSQTFKIDTVAPTTLLTALPAVPDGDNGWFKTTPLITLTNTEPGNTYYQWDSNTGSWNTNGAPFTGVEGEHTVYYYSEDGAGNLEFTQSRLVKTDTGAPTPTALSGSAPSSSQANLSWSASSDAVSGVSQYEIFNADNNAVLQTAGGTSITINGLAAGTTYRYYVKAADVAGNASAASNVVAVTTPALVDDTPPSAPTNVATASEDPSTINLSWNPSTDNVGVTGYRIFNADTNELVATSTVTSCTLSINASSATPAGANIDIRVGMQPGVSYRYYVKAYDAVGNTSTASQPAAVVGSGI